MMKYLFILMLLPIVIGCKTSQNSVRNESSDINLLSVVEDSRSTFRSGFSNLGEAQLSSNILVNVSDIIHEKKVYDDKRNGIKKFVPLPKDSIILIPGLRLKLNNMVSIVEEFNSESNNSILTYLKQIENPKIITSVDVIGDQELLALIKKSDYVFLATSKLTGELVLRLITNDQVTETINLNKYKVFNFEAKSICWGYNRKNRAAIVEIASDSKCNKEAFESYNDFKIDNEKRLNSFSFK